MKHILMSVGLLVVLVGGGYLLVRGSGEEEDIRSTSGPEFYATDAPTSSESVARSDSNAGVKQTNLSPRNKPDMIIDKAQKYSVILRTTAGDITIALHAAKTPITVNNFVVLAMDKFYDNTIFHRAINGFMIQGGDPKGDGTGGPGYRFDDEPFDGEYTRGTVAMANAGPDTNGSQFFIMHADYPLPKNYVIFGKVTDGMEVVDAIATAPVKMNAGGEQSAPMNPVKIKTVDIVVE